MWMWFLSQYLIVLYSPFLWWHEMIKCLRDQMKWGEWRRHDKMPTWSDEARWMTQAPWHRVRLLLTFWWYIRRRIICSKRCWIMEPLRWQRLDVRSRPCGWLGILGGTELGYVRFHQATQNYVQFKTYELLIYGILIFSDRGWPRMTEAADKGGLPQWN